jgi:hypothetical protein
MGMRAPFGLVERNPVGCGTRMPDKRSPGGRCDATRRAVPMGQGLRLGLSPRLTLQEAREVTRRWVYRQARSGEDPIERFEILWCKRRSSVRVGCRFRSDHQDPDLSAYPYYCSEARALLSMRRATVGASGTRVTNRAALRATDPDSPGSAGLTGRCPPLAEHRVLAVPLQHWACLPVGQRTWGRTPNPPLELSHRPSWERVELAGRPIPKAPYLAAR